MRLGFPQASSEMCLGVDEQGIEVCLPDTYCVTSQEERTLGMLPIVLLEELA